MYNTIDFNRNTNQNVSAKHSNMYFYSKCDSSSKRRKLFLSTVRIFVDIEVNNRL